MSGSLYGLEGMGGAGTGYNGTQPTIPPGILQMLMQQRGMMGGAQPMGAPQMAAGAQHPMGQNMAPLMQPQAPQQMPGGMAQMMQSGGLQGLLNALKGQQTGLAPQQPPGAAAQQAAAGAMPQGMPPQPPTANGFATSGGQGSMNQLGQPTNTLPPGLVQMIQRLMAGGGAQGSGVT